MDDGWMDGWMDGWILKGVQELPRLDGDGPQVTKYDVQDIAHINRAVVAQLLYAVTKELL